LNSTFISSNEKSRTVSVQGKKVLYFLATSAGNTEVIMLLLRPWENGTVAERKIFPINIMSAAASKQATIPDKSLVGTTSSTIHLPGNLPIHFPNESVMETPSQAMPSQGEPSRYDMSSLGK